MMHDDPIAASPPLRPIARRRQPMARVALLAFLLLAIGATAWALVERRRSAATSAAAAASAANTRVIPVLTARSVQRDVPVWLEGLGSVSAFYTVTVKTQVDGRIDKVLFTEGQHVRKGDMLVQIDPRAFAIQLESAQAAFARDVANSKNAKVNFERYKTLAQQNLIAVQQMTDQQASVDQLEAQLRADQAQIDAARLNLDYARITSPIDGVTGVRLVDPGNIVHPSDASGLIVVAQLDPIAVLFTLPEDDLPGIHRAMVSGPLTVDALSRDGDKLLASGKLSVIDNAINQATATVRLKAIFDNATEALWPNQFVKARLRLATRSNAIVVPAAVVQHGPQGTFAYLVAADSTAVVRPITVEATVGDMAIVASGLAPGQEVVVEGQAQLRPGVRVAAKPAGPDAPSPDRPAGEDTARTLSVPGGASSGRSGNKP
jgi:multidrug efflux system membrane fusion protein